MSKPISPLGLRIAKRLKAISKTQTWLAGELDLSDNAISKWKYGESYPEYENLLLMRELLQCPVGYLAGDQQDDSIAEVARLMETVDEGARKQVLLGVIAVVASLPKAHDKEKQRAA